MVRSINNLKDSHSEDGNRIEQAKQEKAAEENLNVLMNLATIAVMAEDKVTTKEEPRNLKKHGTTQMWSYKKRVSGDN